ncbi:hypothetical protein F4813DRAFT_389391 [Daldinia decipiens]|uniref:uncharacterized protein n=1 Tax=Daldinia decipiens TaxID=326647 RepID=UPI0020C41C62|nr:uncharacterized protein F4813DRAFT_389391 [Daldinia decipiens]KAI1657655.1 hypothetical protein F4813DRAFT_389391 [Daldinia decipiens]
MYGLPGDPNSQRLNRNATETRIHCLWNHLIETASVSTGSLIIWDTGTYTILPPRETSRRTSCNSQSDEEEKSPELTEQEKLHQTFQTRKIRIRLNGTRLPRNYVLNLRLTKEEDVAGRAKSTRTPTWRRRRGAPAQGRDSARGKGKGKAVEPATSSGSDSGGEPSENEESEIVNAPVEDVDEHGSRLTFPFYVRGVEAERSVVTGRTGGDVLKDEGVVGYIGRKGWRPVLNRIG